MFSCVVGRPWFPAPGMSRALAGGNAEEDIRKKIVDDDLVYGVIVCPPNLFYNCSFSNIC
jgi:type I restriction-modification system DNA methylase subunit